MGYRIKELREAAGLTQEELAKCSGISRVTIATLETKKNYATTTRTLLKIASALHTTIDSLFFADDVQSAEQDGIMEETV